MLSTKATLSLSTMVLLTTDILRLSIAWVSATRLIYGSRGGGCNFLEDYHKLEAFEGGKPFMFKLVSQTVPLIYYLDHNDGVSDEELLDETCGFDLWMCH